MKVAEWMSSPAVVVRPETPVGQVAQLMLERHFRALPVVEADGKLVGIVADADLIAKHAQPHFPLYIQFLEARIYLQGPGKTEAELAKAAGRTARDLMSSDVITVEASADISQAATLMFDNGVACLPVLDGGQIAGVITRSDLLRLLVLEERGEISG